MPFESAQILPARVGEILPKDHLRLLKTAVFPYTLRGIHIHNVGTKNGCVPLLSGFKKSCDCDCGSRDQRYRDNDCRGKDDSVSSGELAETVEIPRSAREDGLIFEVSLQIGRER